MEKELVEYMAKALVDNPSAVKVAEEGENPVTLQLSVDSNDVGKVIGKQGRIAKAMRTLLSACATKNNKHVMLEILD